MEETGEVLKQNTRFFRQYFLRHQKINFKYLYPHPFLETDEQINTIFVAQLYFPKVENLPVLSTLTGIFEEFLK